MKPGEIHSQFPWELAEEASKPLSIISEKSLLSPSHLLYSIPIYCTSLLLQARTRPHWHVPNLVFRNTLTRNLQKSTTQMSRVQKCEPWVTSKELEEGMYSVLTFSRCCHTTILVAQRVCAISTGVAPWGAEKVTPTSPRGIEETQQLIRQRRERCFLV